MTTDKEKVIKGLKACFDSKECDGCPYIDEPYCKTSLQNDVISIIENQRHIVYCKYCKYRSYYCTEDVNGETLYSCHYPCSGDAPRPGNWFCADGEKNDNNINNE